MSVEHEELLAQWLRFFGRTPPLGFRLRDLYCERWVRFHGLPKWKRYPDDPSELKIIIERANILADHLFGEGQECWLVASYMKYSGNNETPQPDRLRYTRDKYDLLRVVDWVDETEDKPDRFVWSTFAKKTNWSSNTFDDILAKIANDEESSVVWFADNQPVVFAPYDGGFDIVLESKKKAAELAQRFFEWLPPQGG